MIPAVCIVQTLLLSGAVFDVQSVPVKEPRPEFFYAQGDAQMNAAVYALAGNELTIHFRSGEAKTLTLPEGVGAFDVFPLKDGEAPQLVCRRGKQVFSIPIGASEQRIEPALLFELESAEPGIPEKPFPRVMVITQEGRRGIVLPVEGGQEFRSVSGELIASYPDVEPSNVSGGVPRVYTSSFVKLPSHTGGLTLLVSDFEQLGSELPDEFTYVEPVSGHHKQIHQPEFPLSRTDPSLLVGYSYHGETWDTLIQMPTVARKSNAPRTDEKPDKKGPARRYPGTLMVDGEYAPDFNGDGYTDLLLWSAPKPGLSIDSLIRTAIGNTWPVRLTVHLYSTDKKRFDPAPMVTISMQIPVFWFVEVGKGHPFPLWLVRDFDGDGKTDLLLPTSDSELSVWLAKDGFDATPSDTLTFLEPLEEIVASSDADAKGRTGIVIQGRNRLFILWPKQ